MFFWLKKQLGYWLMPVPMGLLLLVVGSGLLVTRRRPRLGRALMLTGTGLLLVLSNILVSKWLIRPFENRYPPIPELRAGVPLPPALAECRYVVVLGSGNGNSAGLSALAELSSSASARLAEAVRILHALPEAKLLLSGPAERLYASHATVLARAAISLGIEERRITLIENGRDTEDESLSVREKIGRQPFALVTTAWHMPRAMALFRHAGLTPVPCPTDYTGHLDPDWKWNNLMVDVGSLERSTAAFHELLGNAWIWLRGKG